MPFAPEIDALVRALPTLKNEPLPVSTPPCTSCRNWSPSVLRDRLGAVHRIQLCAAESQHRDFSCWEAAEPPSFEARMRATSFAGAREEVTKLFDFLTVNYLGDLGRGPHGETAVDTAIRLLSAPSDAAERKKARNEMRQELHDTAKRELTEGARHDFVVMLDSLLDLAQTPSAMKGAGK
jgi:hypothetical protein